jgi:hypothetical protein
MVCKHTDWCVAWLLAAAVVLDPLLTPRRSYVHSGATKFDNDEIRTVIAKRLGSEAGQLANEMDFLPIVESVASHLPRSSCTHVCVLLTSLRTSTARPVQPRRRCKVRCRLPARMPPHPCVGPHHRLALLGRDGQGREGRRLRGGESLRRSSLSRPCARLLVLAVASPFHAPSFHYEAHSIWRECTDRGSRAETEGD